MTDLSLKERTTIEAVVEGMQKRAQKKRKRSRQGWAFLITGTLAMPIIAAAFSGAITTTTAASRIGIALLITSGIGAMIGSLMDSYQGQAAVKSVQEAVIEAKKKAEELAEEADDMSDASDTFTSTSGGSNTAPGDASDNGADDEG